MSYGDLKGWNKICQNDFVCSNVSLKEQIVTNCSYNYNFMFNLVTLHENYGLP